MTPISNEYPEGAESLFTMCGTDVTEAFVAKNIPGEFYARMSEYRQGALES